MSRGEKIDLYLKKWVSRKLTILVIASAALFAGSLESSDWTVVAAMYIAIEGATNIAERLMKARASQL
jgi:hypothetical protein